MSTIRLGPQPHRGFADQPEGSGLGRARDGFYVMSRKESEMGPKPFPGFRSLETHHCMTGSMRHVYEHNGYPISEELLLGLGAGVGFVYWHVKGSPPMIAS